MNKICKTLNKCLYIKIKNNLKKCTVIAQSMHMCHECKIHINLTQNQFNILHRVGEGREIKKEKRKKKKIIINIIYK